MYFNITYILKQYTYFRKNIHFTIFKYINLLINKICLKKKKWY